MIPDTMFLWSTTGKNCTGEGGDSIFSMASTAIASAVIVLGFLGHQAGVSETAVDHNQNWLHSTDKITSIKMACKKLNEISNFN
jgi:hypothetical protein